MNSDSDRAQDLPFLRQEAQTYAKFDRSIDDSQKTKKQADIDPFEFGLPKNVIIGVGGLGNSVIQRLSAMNLDGAETVAVDTDMLCLNAVDADHKIQIGNSIIRRNGTGGFPAIGDWIGEKARSSAKDVLKDGDLVFVTAGMGGGTGTGAAPVIAQIAKEQGALVIAMVALPLVPINEVPVELSEGISKLQAAADAVILLDTRKLQERVPAAQAAEVYSMACQLIADTIQLIIDMLLKPTLINIKYSDIRSIVYSGRRGVGILLTGEGAGPNRYDELVAAMLNNPLSTVDYRKAAGGLLFVIGGPDLSLRDCQKIGEMMTEDLDRYANVMWNGRIRKDYADRVRAVAILTGFGDYREE